MADNTFTIPELDQIGTINQFQDLLIIEDVSLGKTFKTTVLQFMNPFRINQTIENVGVGYTPPADVKFGVFGNAEMTGNITAVDSVFQNLTVDHSVVLNDYGSGSLVDNTVNYILGVSSNGSLIEIETSSITASDNLGDHKATQSLDMDNQSIVNVTNIIGQSESVIKIKDSSSSDLATFNSTSVSVLKSFSASSDVSFDSYGAGNLIDNTASYLLAVSTSGAVKEYELTNLSPIQLITSALLSGETDLYEDYVVGLGDGQFILGEKLNVNNNYSIDLPSGDNVYSKTYININENSSLDDFYTENKCDYFQIMNTNFWSSGSIINGVSLSDRLTTMTLHKSGTMTLGPDHSISPADRVDENDFVKTSLFVGNSAVAPYSSSNTHLIIADGKNSTRGDKMVSITNKGGTVIGSIPSRIVSQKNPSYTLQVKDGYSCIVDVTALVKVSSVGDSSLAIGDLATVKASFILNNDGGTLSSEQIGSDVSTSLGATTLSIATSISNDPAEKSFTIFLNATNLGTNGFAKVSAQFNYTWLK